MHAEHTPRSGGFLRSRTALTLLAFLAIAAFLLLGEHRVHALGYLPYALLLLCPLLHLFMHGGHGKGNHADHADHARGDQPRTGGPS